VATDPQLLWTLCPSGGGTPLFLVPSVGTTPLSFVRLARALSPPRPVHAFGYAGMDDDAAPHATIEAMAAACNDELLARSPRGPWALGGHCFGGVVALEMTRQLEAQDRDVARLVLIETIPPPLAGAGAASPGDAAQAAALEAHARSVLEALVARTAQHAQLLEADVARRVRTVIEHHVSTAIAYRARPVRAGADLFRTAQCSSAVRAGWSPIVGGGLADHAIPGDTFSLLQPPHVADVGRSIGAALRAADR
jgi:thioesterase domain-containing protein